MNYLSLQENWKKITQLENRYEISNYGRIRNTRTLQVLKAQISNSGYLRICLRTQQGKKRQFSIHRLVAKYFVPNPMHKPEVNHKDENRLNNSVFNLEWVTQKENVNYGTGIERQRTQLFKPVIQLSISNKYIAFYPSLKAAAKTVKCNSSQIWRVANGQRKTAHGYKWKYAEDFFKFKKTDLEKAVDKVKEKK
ncbi:NUMOD4 domain-containing protein [Lactobacillus crispatus]|uniref:NUMOD4 domain-containing protein n=1 Tax=Lactobacillus crispatus TaxID=47770 RepID=UPI0030F79590